MTEPINCNDLLISDSPGVGIVAGALKTSGAPRIVHGADKHIELNEWSVHSMTILLV